MAYVYLSVACHIGTDNVDDISTSDFDNNGASQLIRPHYYDSLDDSAEKPSVPSIASSFIKTQSSSSTAAVYNNVAKKLMVCYV